MQEIPDDSVTPLKTVEFKKRIGNKLNELLEADKITKAEHVDSLSLPSQIPFPRLIKTIRTSPPGRPTLAAIGSLAHHSIP